MINTGRPWGGHDGQEEYDRMIRARTGVDIGEQRRRAAKMMADAQCGVPAITPMRTKTSPTSSTVYAERLAAAFQNAETPAPATDGWDAEKVATAFHKAMHPLAETPEERRANGSTVVGDRWVPGCYR